MNRLLLWKGKLLEINVILQLLFKYIYNSRYVYRIRALLEFGCASHWEISDHRRPGLCFLKFIMPHNIVTVEAITE